MAAVAVTTPVHGVTVDGKRSVTVTLGAGADLDTIAAPAKLGLRTVHRVWKDVTSEFDQAAGGGITLDSAQAAGTYRFEGL
jgi:hypothetical protein